MRSTVCPNPVSLLAAGLGLLAGCQAGPTHPVASLVATVRQAGPVGYRDPIGVLSPDGGRLATVIPNQLLVHDLQNGTERRLPLTDARIQHLTWRSNRELVLGQPDGPVLWWAYDIHRGTRQPLWPGGARLGTPAGDSVDPALLRELTWSPDGARGAGVEPRPQGSRLWEFDAGGRALSARSFPTRLGHPHWMRDGRIACLSLEAARQRVTLPCGEKAVAGLEERDAYGPIGSSPDGRELYVALANDSGFVGLWAWSMDGTPSGRRLSGEPRDTYAPSVSRDGMLLFKDQDYWTEVQVVASEGGPAQRRTAFQAETPSWDPTGTRLGITFGTWRRVVDDFHYPDIAQDVGIIPATDSAPANRVEQVIQQSESEDQGLTWSPNGRWIAFHSHQQNSDDVWLRPAGQDGPLTRISDLGRGAEVGWPRWSPDGRWIVFDGGATGDGQRQSRVWIVGVDQETGKVTVPARQVPTAGLVDPVLHAEWLGSSDTIVFSTSHPPTGHAMYRVARSGGTPQLIHRYESPQRIDGFGVGPDGAWLVYPAPDDRGRLQLFRLRTKGGSPEQLTRDSTDKTQPAVSPDGRWIAYTAWRYQARFWILPPRGDR